MDMSDPISATDPAMVVGLMAALGSIGLALRTRYRAAAPEAADRPRRLWFTRAAGVVLERAADLIERAEETTDAADAAIDLRPREIDLTDRIDLTAGNAGNTTEDGAEPVATDAAARPDDPVG